MAIDLREGVPQIELQKTDKEKILIPLRGREASEFWGVAHEALVPVEGTDKMGIDPKIMVEAVDVLLTDTLKGSISLGQYQAIFTEACNIILDELKGAGDPNGKKQETSVESSPQS